MELDFYLLVVGGQFSRFGSKERKIDHVDAEHAPGERLVVPTLWPSLNAHVVASPGSHAALEVG